MGLNVRRSIKIGSHARLNISKSGIGMSTGIKGAHVSIGPHGVRKTVGIPGTGIYYTKQSSFKNKNSRISNSINSDNYKSSKPLSSFGRFGYRFLAVILFIFAGFLFLCGIAILPVGLIFWVATIFIIVGGISLIKKSNRNCQSKQLLTNIHTINTRVVGVTFGDRQEYLKGCGEGDEILIVHIPSEKFPHAMGVYTLADDDNILDFNSPRKTKNLLGYLNDSLAKSIYDSEVHEVGLTGEIGPFPGSITEITGGTEDKPLLGCNIAITV